MARYLGPVCKLCRREREKLFLKGRKCVAKCTLERRAKPPGTARPQRGRPSEYAVRLREKQKLRRMVQMMERPFEVLMKRASKIPGKTGESLLRFLELRLDNIVRRLGFASSLRAARQLVAHGYVLVNKRKVNVASCTLRAGDEVRLDPAVAGNVGVRASLEMAEKSGARPSFLEFKPGELSGRILRPPSRDEMSFPVQENLIVEYYSK